MDLADSLPIYVRAFKKRWWIVLLPTLLFGGLSTLIAFVLPPVYSSVARILIESQQIPAELARSTVTGGVAERIALIEQRLMTRQNLLDVAQRFDVFRDRPDMTPTQIVTEMRAATLIEGVRLSGRGAPVTGINISFEASRANTAAQVTNEFLALLLEQNIRQRNERAIETNNFFSQEVDRLQQSLARIGSEITRFKIENSDALPDSLGFRRSEVSRLKAQIFERELQIAALNERRKLITEAIASGETSFEGADALPPTPQEDELNRLNRTLVQQSAVYAETHPAIRALRSRIATLEASLQDSPPERLQGEEGSGAPSPVDLLNQQISEVDAQIGLLEERSQQEQRQVDVLEATIERTPQIDLELDVMRREEAALQSQLSQAQLRQSEADRGERLEVNNQAERFEIIEQAQAAPRPDSPNRPVIMAAGFVGGIGMGVGIVVLLELLNRALRTPLDVERKLNMQPLAVIPYIHTASELRRGRWMTRIILVGLLVFVPLLLLILNTFVMPLERIGDRIVSATRLNLFIDMIQQRFSR